MSILVASSRAIRFLALLMLVSIGFAAPCVMAAPTTHESASQPEGEFVNHLGNRAIEILKATNSTKEKRDEEFRVLLRQSFDLKTIARFVLGQNWLRANDQQQKEYLDLFEQLVIKTYSDRFTFYTGEGFRVTSVDPQGSKDVVVTSEIIHPDGSKPTSVVWRIRNRNGKLNIIDVVVEGISMSVTQRQEYSAIIQRHGGEIEPLLDMMRQRVSPKKS